MSLICLSAVTLKKSQRVCWILLTIQSPLRNVRRFLVEKKVTKMSDEKSEGLFEKLRSKKIK